MGDVKAGNPEGGEHSWEYVGGQAWDSVAEDAEGNLVGIPGRGGTSVADVVRRRRKLRARHDAAGGRRVVRDMIRYVYLLIDMSRAMGEKDPALPGGTRLSVTVGLAAEFVDKFFDENPISHLGIVILKDGEAEMLTQLSGNPRVHVRALTRAAAASPTGEFSLQNGLEVAGRSLGHMPKYGSREVVVLCGALSTCDPSDLIVETLPRLRQAEIRVSCIALAAEIYVCRRLAEETYGTMNVCLEKNHYRELFLAQCIPPPTLPHQVEEERASGGRRTCEFVQMGFPTREASAVPSLIHATKDKKIFARTGYLCPRCKAKAHELPTDCAVCGLKLVLSPHLARSFHHLFPVPAFVELPPQQEEVVGPEEAGSGGAQLTSSSGVVVKPTSSGAASTGKVGPTTVDATLLISSEDSDVSCYACLKYIGPPAAQPDDGKVGKKSGKKSGRKGATAAATVTDEATSANLRFRCPDCGNIFCADCDAYLHETLHNCPGCLCKGA